jgi:STE24 endopeptidase
LHNRIDGQPAGQYSRIRYRLALADILFSLFLSWYFIWSGASLVLAQWLRAHAGASLWAVLPAYVLICGAAYQLLMLPSAYYRGFVLEHAFGLSRQNIRQWLADQAKGWAVSAVLTVAAAAGWAMLVRISGDWWWLTVAAGWYLASVVLARVAPLVLVPLFFKYSPLPDPGLRERLLHLARRMRVALLECYQIDFGKKTVKANAAFLGWGATRRVVLADTLLSAYSHDEVEAVMAHELAHFKRGHLAKLLLYHAGETLLVCYLMYSSSGWLLRWSQAGTVGEAAFLPVVFLCVSAWGILTQPLANLLSRTFEREADRLALEATGNPEAFIAMMQKLSRQNLSDPAPSLLAKIFFFSHPPASERIAAATRRISLPK